MSEQTKTMTMNDIMEFLKKIEKSSKEEFKQMKQQMRRQEIGDSSKEIEDKEETMALLSENKFNRNKENMKHIEINIKGVKHQIIMKTKEIGIIRPNKIKNTREELDMIKNELVNVLNLPIIDHREDVYKRQARYLNQHYYILTIELQ